MSQLDWIDCNVLMCYAAEFIERSLTNYVHFFYILKHFFKIQKTWLTFFSCRTRFSYTDCAQDLLMLYVFHLCTIALKKYLYIIVCHAAHVTVVSCQHISLPCTPCFVEVVCLCTCDYWPVVALEHSVLLCSKNACWDNCHCSLWAFLPGSF